MINGTRQSQGTLRSKVKSRFTNRGRKNRGVRNSKSRTKTKTTTTTRTVVRTGRNRGQGQQEKIFFR